MKGPQLSTGAFVVALLAVAGCSREETREEAREAATRARAAAARASDQFADNWLTTKIQAQYFADADVKARNIDVSTRDGAVVLTGTVDDERARQQAVQIARNTDGVRTVEDRLTVGSEAAAAASPEIGSPPPASASPEPEATPGAVPTTGAASPLPSVVATDDEAVTTRIQAKYFLDNALKAREIAVTTEGAVVTLGGEVASEAERAQALLLARTTEGVQRVEDHLTVNASLVPSAGPAALPSAAPPAAVPSPAPVVP